MAKRVYSKSFLPMDFTFRPNDNEALCFLRRKVSNKSLPPNNITEAPVYRTPPHLLAEGMHGLVQSREWYFLTCREFDHTKSYRIIDGYGYWMQDGQIDCMKCCNCDCNYAPVGFKTALDYYQGSYPNGLKSHWKMFEYTINYPAVMKDAEWMLCKIYKQIDEDNEETFEFEEEFNLMMLENHNLENDDGDLHEEGDGEENT